MSKTVPFVMAMAIISLSASVDVAAAPPIRATKVQASCSNQVTNCGGAILTLANNNGVSITLDPLTHSFYDSKPAGLQYTIYPVNGPAIVSFTCKKGTLNFHSSKLLDDTTYKLQITAGGAQSGFYEFTTTKPCKGVKAQEHERHE